MKTPQHILFKRVLIGTLCSLLAVATSSGLSAQSSSLTPQERGLWRFLQNYVDGPDPRNEDTRIAVALVDLNGDRREEALVYVMGRDWCGSGGCNLWILRFENRRWKMITDVSIARRPIRIFNRRHNGWSDIGVYVRGGGVINGYEAALHYERGTYPSNPSLITADPRSPQLGGRIVIDTEDQGRALFP